MIFGDATKSCDRNGPEEPRGKRRLRNASNIATIASAREHQLLRQRTIGITRRPETTVRGRNDHADRNDEEDGSAGFMGDRREQS
jgi:hypothetical protein